eukprot:g17692.t1
MNAIYKFADDTTVVGWISSYESKYKRAIEDLVMWYNENNLCLNIGKTKELIIDFRKKGGEHTPISINGAEVEMGEDIKFLGLRKFGMSIWPLTNFYRCIIESTLSGYSNCSAQDCKKLQKVMCTAQTI